MIDKNKNLLTDLDDFHTLLLANLQKLNSYALPKGLTSKSRFLNIWEKFQIMLIHICTSV